MESDYFKFRKCACGNDLLTALEATDWQCESCSDKEWDEHWAEFDAKREEKDEI